MRIIFLLLCVLPFSCVEKEPKEEMQILDFGAFTIEAPSSWTKIEAKGIDSYVGQIAIGNSDTLHFDFGWYSNDLYESDPTILDSSQLESIDLSLFDTSNTFFVKDRRKVDPDMFKKNNITWDTIDNRKAKIVAPRRSGSGTTGVYFDSVWESGSAIDKFNLYGENLKSTNEKEVLAAIKTLKFHEQ